MFVSDRDMGALSAIVMHFNVTQAHPHDHSECACNISYSLTVVARVLFLVASKKVILLPYPLREPCHCLDFSGTGSSKEFGICAWYFVATPEPAQYADGRVRRPQISLQL